VTTVTIRVAPARAPPGPASAITPFELGKRLTTMTTQLPESVSKWDAPFLLGVFADRLALHGK
jgi:hypothetical protein